tara:strand:- start:308 stop:646 length:339 start_codon:yes stop_codon:yes gene_type:complete
MCGGLISGIFGGGRTSAPAAPPIPVTPTPPPAPMPVQQAPVPLPEGPTPAPVEEDPTKRKAKIRTRKRPTKGRQQQGTSRLQTKKPEAGGLKGIKTGQGVNVSKEVPTGGSY